MPRIHHENLDEDVPATSDHAVLHSAVGCSAHLLSKDEEAHEKDPVEGRRGRRAERGGDETGGNGGDNFDEDEVTATGRGVLRWRDDLPASFHQIRSSKDYDELHLNGCRVGNFAMQLLCESIWTRLTPAPVPAPASSSASTLLLRSLELFECPGLNEVALRALAGLVASDAPLERLSVQYGLVAEASVEPLLEALKTNTRLRELTIRTGALPIRLGDKAASAVGQSRTLTSLTLSALDINLEGMEMLALRLRSNDRLESLELASALTRIPAPAFHELVSKHNWRLETVYLQGVPDREHQPIVEWVTERNRGVRRSVLAWENVARTGRIVVAVDAPTDPSASSTASCPVLRLLPRALHSFQSKPALVYRMLRDQHLDDLVGHWQQQQQKQQTMQQQQTPTTTTTTPTQQHRMMAAARTAMYTTTARAPTRKKPGLGRAVYFQKSPPPPPPLSHRPRRHPAGRSGGS
jgi:hypothetical protein